MDQYFGRREIYLSPLGWATFRLDDGLQPLGHGAYELLTVFLGNTVVPDMLHTLPKLCNSFWFRIVCVQLLFKVRPDIFNRIEVRRVCRPVHNLNTILLKPLAGEAGRVFGIIVLVV